MNEEIVHLKLPIDVYKKLKKLAEIQHRTVHSLLRHLSILAVEHEWRIQEPKK